MNVYETILSRRSIREFTDKTIDRKLLEKFVNAARFSPQAANVQPLEYIVVDDIELCKRIFPLVKFASHLEWNPSSERRPKAYVAIVSNTKIAKVAWIGYDVGIAANNLGLAAWEDGVGSCMIGAFNKSSVTKLLQIPEGYELNLLVALGYPAHRSLAEDMTDDDIKYRRDDDGTFHVPKRLMRDILHFNRF